jgi:hypothetical protein
MHLRGEQREGRWARTSLIHAKPGHSCLTSRCAPCANPSLHVAWIQGAKAITSHRALSQALEEAIARPPAGTDEALSRRIASSKKLALLLCPPPS